MMRNVMTLVVLALIGIVMAAAPAEEELQPLAQGKVQLLDSTFRARAARNRDYVSGLKNVQLLQNHLLEAALPVSGELQGGWEAPSHPLRGHFLGHWLSAAAAIAASGTDPEMKVRAELLIAELSRIQRYNGGRWIAGIPEKFLFWIAQGKPLWAPHYNVHKTLMGLVDAYKIIGSVQALEVAENFAAWFHGWTAPFSREEMDNILDVETGGMLEVWADLYGATGKPMYLDLMQRYRRGRLFDRLLAGEDVLTNKHANTTVPEALGAARAYEVTGDPKWRDIVRAYWDSAVTNRGSYCTGGQTNGEVWSPPFRLAARLGEKTQEHCVVYNMIRLADFLFRWTGEPRYADYIERNIYNGLLAQQHPGTAMVTYYLPLRPGAKKTWATPTGQFFCCNGTVMQAQTRHDRYIYYRDRSGLTVAQYLPSEVSWEERGGTVRLRQTTDPQANAGKVHVAPTPAQRPANLTINLELTSAAPVEFTLRLRLPWWLHGRPLLSINGQDHPAEFKPSSFIEVRRTWRDKDRVRLVIPKGLSIIPLPDRPDAAAFMYGPEVLAGLTPDDAALYGDKDRPDSILAPDNELQWGEWTSGFRTVGQERSFEFIPLNAVIDQVYTVYFPIRSSSSGAATTQGGLPAPSGRRKNRE